jgi:putative transposase
LGKESELCTPHHLFLALGSESKERQSNYRELFKYHVEGEFLEAIRLAINKGLVLGNERFEMDVERLTGRRMTAKKRGRPVGWRKKAEMS